MTLALGALVCAGMPGRAQVATGPRVELVPAPTTVVLPGLVDSNSPLVWDRIEGTLRLFVMTSVDGQPHVASGPDTAHLGRAVPAHLEPWPGGGVWMEAVIADSDGTWYGYFHNEVPAPACPDTARQSPRVGAARSRDHGRTWESLGIILDVPPASASCTTRNKYFDGGVGDISVLLDPNSQDLYFFISSYPRFETRQGVSVARMAWADRDNPSGRVAVWVNRTFVPATRTVAADGAIAYSYPLSTPIFSTTEGFFDADPRVDVFWGPSVHWNAFIERYVMLLNHAHDEQFSPDGVYVSLSASLSDPRGWSAPVRLTDASAWYPEVVGLAPGTGTDKRADEYARFFVGGVSTQFLHAVR